MQENKSSPIIREASRFSWFSSLVLLILTLIAIAGFHIYQYFSETTINTLHTDITQLDSAIELASKDKDVIVANIMNSASIRPSIDLKSIVRSFRMAAGRAGVRLQGFSVKDDILTSTLIAHQDSDGVDPIQTIIAMMRITNPESGLLLDPIFTLHGSTEERRTSVSFRILPSNLTPNVQK